MNPAYCRCFHNLVAILHWYCYECSYYLDFGEGFALLTQHTAMAKLTDQWAICLHSWNHYRRLSWTAPLIAVCKSLYILLQSALDVLFLHKSAVSKSSYLLRHCYSLSPFCVLRYHCKSIVVFKITPAHLSSQVALNCKITWLPFYNLVELFVCPFLVIFCNTNCLQACDD